jgi:hypothetical protein
MKEINEFLQGIAKAAPWIERAQGTGWAVVKAKPASVGYLAGADGWVMQGGVLQSSPKLEYSVGDTQGVCASFYHAGPGAYSLAGAVRAVWPIKCALACPVGPLPELAGHLAYLLTEALMAPVSLELDFSLTSAAATSKRPKTTSWGVGLISFEVPVAPAPPCPPFPKC